MYVFIVSRYAGVYDEMLSPPPRNVEPPYGSRYDCKNVTSVFVHLLSPSRKTCMVVDIQYLPNGLNLCLRSKCLSVIKIRILPTFFLNIC